VNIRKINFKDMEWIVSRLSGTTDFVNPALYLRVPGFRISTETGSF
jgi:hypothetical protein